MSGEEESKIIGDIGIKSLFFKIRFGLSVWKWET